MRIKEIPWYNRPYTKIRNGGVSSLNRAELLAVIFEKGNFENNAIDLSNRLLSKYNLNEFSECNLSELKEILEDEIKCFRVLCLGELFKEYSKICKGGYSIKKIETPRDLFKIFVDELRNTKKEHLFVVLLDSESIIISKHLVSVGTLNSSLMHPREVFKHAIKNSAFSIGLVHNHPGGDVYPSSEDLEVTKKIISVGEIIGIPLKYHVIINETDWHNIEII